MIPPEVFIPAAVSLIIGVLAHIVSLVISKGATKSKLDIRGIDSLETQLENKSQEVTGLRQSNLDLRDLKYQLELKIESLKRERDQAEESESELREENARLREELFEARQKLAKKE